ncbi:MAG: thioredoxin domain-containing protein [Culicoidibacterales bacterium]
MLKLNSENFGKTIYESLDMFVIAFSAPWCGHCRSLKPEWEKAAKVLKEDNIILGWVDATEDESLAEIFGIDRYPLIKIFPEGNKGSTKNVKTYNGGRDADSIVKFFQKRI